MVPGPYWHMGHVAARDWRAGKRCNCRCFEDAPSNSMSYYVHCINEWVSGASSNLRVTCLDSIIASHQVQLPTPWLSNQNNHHRYTDPRPLQSGKQPSFRNRSKVCRPDCTMRWISEDCQSPRCKMCVLPAVVTFSVWFNVDKLIHGLQQTFVHLLNLDILPKIVTQG